MMLPLNPLYEVVPVSEPPVVDGIYMTKWKGVPAWTEKEFKDGRWQTQFDWTGLLTHYLRPLPPERMEEWVREIIDKSIIDNIKLIVGPAIIKATETTHKTNVIDIDAGIDAAIKLSKVFINNLINKMSNGKF